MKADKTIVKFIGYIRQSQTHEGTISLDEQRTEIEHWARRPGKEVEIVWLQDVDWSGKNLERPDIRKALHMLDAGKADGIVVSKLDRLTRNVGDLSRLIEKMKEGGWHIVCLDMGGETVDFASRNGKLMGYMVAMFAEWYRDGTVEEWERHRRHKILHEGAHWGQEPLGFRRGMTTNLAGDAKPGPLVIDREWAPVVREAFRRRARGETWLQIAKYLMANGAPNALARARAKKSGTRAAGSAWTAGGARAMIRNRVYLGEARAGDLVKLGAHPPLIDERLWRKANRAKGSFPERKRAQQALLAGGRGHGNGGILRCGTCGKTLSHSTSGRLGGKKYLSYRCTNYVCPTRANISATRIESYLIEKALEIARTTGSPEMDSDTSHLQAQLLLLEKEREALESTRAQGRIRDQNYWEQASRIDEEIEAAETALREAELDDHYDWRTVPLDELESHLFKQDDDRLVARDVSSARAFLLHTLGSVTVFAQNGISAGVKDVADRVQIQHA
jgi:DNA invertase Pin-like site-specific DNA recombinase